MQRIKSISFDQDEILVNIVHLHTGPIECDVTYGKGNFYKALPTPSICLDLHPQGESVTKADVRNLPLEDAQVSCIAFDPPFLIRTGPGAVLKDRFGAVIGNMQTLWDFYEDAMREIHRVLKPDGWLIFKCQDGVLSGVNHFTHVEICNRAIAIGFRPVDLFVLLARHRMTDPTHLVQKHARKYHSYFWVFKKTDKVRP